MSNYLKIYLIWDIISDIILTLIKFDTVLTLWKLVSCTTSNNHTLQHFSLNSGTSSYPWKMKVSIYWGHIWYHILSVIQFYYFDPSVFYHSNFFLVKKDPCYIDIHYMSLSMWFWANLGTWRKYWKLLSIYNSFYN